MRNNFWMKHLAGWIRLCFRSPGCILILRRKDHWAIQFCAHKELKPEVLDVLKQLLDVLKVLVVNLEKELAQDEAKAKNEK